MPKGVEFPRWKLRGTGLGEFTAHAQAFEEIDGFGEGLAGSGKVATERVEAGGGMCHFIGTAAITAFLVAALAGSLAGRREPQIVYVQTVAERTEEGAGCLPLIILMICILLVIAFGR